jgi:hypothetical protein
MTTSNKKPNKTQWQRLEWHLLYHRRFPLAVA